MASNGRRWTNDKSRPAVVYMVVNKRTGKKYIGVTHKSPHKRFREHVNAAKYRRHNGHFYRSLRKNDPDEYEISVLVQCDSVSFAMKEEARLISELKPEYNSTKGGEGRSSANGDHFTAEGKERVRQANRGNSYHLGHKHSDRTRNFLKELAKTPEEKERWAKFQSLGPMASRRRVLCLDDLQMHESASAAARFYGVAKSAIIELCLGQRGRKTIGGLRFRYADAN